MRRTGRQALYHLQVWCPGTPFQSSSRSLSSKVGVLVCLSRTQVITHSDDALQRETVSLSHAGPSPPSAAPVVTGGASTTVVSAAGIPCGGTGSAILAAVAGCCVSGRSIGATGKPLSVSRCLWRRYHLAACTLDLRRLFVTAGVAILDATAAVKPPAAA